MKYKTKQTLKQIVSILLLCAVGFGAVVGISAISKKLNSDDKTIHPTFSVGSITSAGKGDSSDKSSIYTKDAFECKGLKVELDFDATVRYQAFFYDELGNYISNSATEKYDESEDLSAVIPTDAVYARLVVTPDDDEDGEIKWYEVSKYSSQLTIKVLRDQGNESDKESDNKTKSVALFSDVTTTYSDVSSMKLANVSISPFVWSNTSYLAGKRITKIGVPVKTLTDCTKDQVMTLTLYDISNGLQSRTAVKTIPLTIKANTYSSNTVNEWVYFDVDIEVGAAQTIGFNEKDDSLLFAYVQTIDSRFSFYNSSNQLSPDASIVFDIYVEK